MLDLERYAAEIADSEKTAVAVGVYERGGSEWVVLGAPRDARFRIASLTKPFVAQLALTFVDEELLELDSPALPGAPTPRELLAHEGGLQPDLAAMERFGEERDALGAAVREVLAQKPRFRPGSAWEYANSGYWIVADALARAAGEEFEQILDRRLLRPLGLTDTGWSGERVVAAYDERLRPVTPTPYPRARRPSGGLVSTIGDLLRSARSPSPSADAVPRTILGGRRSSAGVRG